LGLAFANETKKMNERKMNRSMVESLSEGTWYLILVGKKNSLDLRFA